MPREQLTRMDVDVNILYHRKVRKLQLARPADWPVILMAWFGQLGEAWKSGNRLLSLEDSWVPAINQVTPSDALAALKAAGLLDKRGYIPDDTWEQWHGPAERRSAAGRTGAAARWQSDRNPTAMPITNQPTNQPTKPRRSSDTTDKTIIRRSRERNTEPMTPFKDAMAQAGLDPKVVATAGGDPLTSD